MFPCVHPGEDGVNTRLEKLTLQVVLDVALECADPALPGLGPVDFLLVVGLSGL